MGFLFAGVFSVALALDLTVSLALWIHCIVFLFTACLLAPAPQPIKSNNVVIDIRLCLIVNGEDRRRDLIQGIIKKGRIRSIFNE